MSTTPPPSLFYRSISHALSSWTALATCVRAGAGGRDSAAKAEWLVGATEQWMTENQNVEPEELADFYQEVLWNEFDTVVDDGSLNVAKTICDYQTKIKRGLKADVESAIQEAPKLTLNVSIAPDDDDDSDDGVETNSGLTRNGISGTSGDDASSSNRTVGEEGAEEMDVDDQDKTEEIEDDGWTTVKKGGKKKR